MDMARDAAIRDAANRAIVPFGLIKNMPIRKLTDEELDNCGVVCTVSLGLGFDGQQLGAGSCRSKQTSEGLLADDDDEPPKS
jgi:hypothetical protein